MRSRSVLRHLCTSPKPKTKPCEGGDVAKTQNLRFVTKTQNQVKEETSPKTQNLRYVTQNPSIFVLRQNPKPSLYFAGGDVGRAATSCSRFIPFFNG
ncbi:hypothetical protein L6452_44151 [Arctium lappa]|uniref:Uncharacterized protein n=1 Tax=Arctium lappa TaxID=4217 RepID=A0ACB8XFA2_ARCLA|nr:hypothetical protein L6452_44151 [Arctium lappa]